MLKKTIAALLSLLILISFSGCGEAAKPVDPYIEASNEFLATTNDSYVAMLNISIHLLESKIEIVDKGNATNFGDYLELYDLAISTAQQNAAKYFNTLDHHYSRIEELYTTLCANAGEHSDIKALAVDMYENYHAMYDCVTKNISSYPYWQEEFDAHATDFDASMKKLKAILRDLN